MIPHTGTIRPSIHPAAILARHPELRGLFVVGDALDGQVRG